LLSVYVANQRLLADRIFLAHAASLRQTSFFARWKFGGFLHSFNPHVRQPRLLLVGIIAELYCQF
ncbi:MAG: hypothetical protein WCA15_19810, partial [Candidatus Acidiferrales bacterium]